MIDKETIPFGSDKPLMGDSDGDVSALINAFRYFNESTSSLNQAYHRLEKRVEELTLLLDEKDRELYGKIKELDRVKRYLTSVLEGISSGVIAIDLDGNIIIFNGTAASMCGINAEECVGNHYTKIMGEPEIEASALYTLHNGPELRCIEKTLPGNQLQVEVSTAWVVDSLGERVGVVELFDDITTIRRLEERFEHQKTLSALGEMASAVAHELRNPLAGIGGFAALLKEDLADDFDKLKLIDKVLQGVGDLERIASNLLFLTRRSGVKRDQVDLNALLTDLVQLLQAEIHRDNLKVVLTARLPEENVPLSADRELLKMIFINVIRNAIQAVEVEGIVLIKLEWMLLHNRVKVEIIDNGCGIEPEDQPKLFNPFFTTRTRGTGLGLALVKKAVDLHRGEITVDSRVGKGSTFTVNLPIKPFKPVHAHTSELSSNFG
jgi:PAS domain S-box-containing protein